MILLSYIIISKLFISIKIDPCAIQCDNCTNPEQCEECYNDCYESQSAKKL